MRAVSLIVGFLLVGLLAACAEKQEAVQWPKKLGSVYQTELPRPLKKAFACVAKNIDGLGEFKRREEHFPKQKTAVIYLSIEDAPDIFVLEFAGNKKKTTAVQIFVKPGMTNFNNLLREQVDGCKGKANKKAGSPFL